MQEECDQAFPSSRVPRTYLDPAIHDIICRLKTAYLLILFLPLKLKTQWFYYIMSERNVAVKAACVKTNILEQNKPLHNVASAF